MGRKFRIYCVLFLSILTTTVSKLTSASAQLNINVDCAVETDEALLFDGTLLLHWHQEDESRFVLADFEGQIVDFASAPSNFQPYYNPSNSDILLWIRTPTNVEKVDNVRFSVEVWSLGIPQIPINDFSIPRTYSPIQWLDNNQFLFSNVAEGSFPALSVDTGDIQTRMNSDDFPDMRLIPVTPREDYDLAFSPDGQYAAYESEAIGRGIIIWDMETSRELSRFPSDESLAVSRPIWSYDSEHLAFALFVETEMQLFIFNVRSGQATQATTFDTQLPEFGRPWSTIQTIAWSPDSRFVAFNGTLENSRLHIINIETMTVTDICVDNAPVFWLPLQNLLVLSGSPIRILDVENNQIYVIVSIYGQPIGASPLSINILNNQN